MIASRPYLLRALNEWLLDNGLTPHILVNAELDGVVVPARFIEDGKIVLNISPSAVKGLTINNDHLFFNARFCGDPMRVEVPVSAVMAIYARENNQGMLFAEEDVDAMDTDHERTRAHSKPHLKLVK